MNAAEDEAKKLKDDFVSVEHFLLAGRSDKDVQAVFVPVAAHRLTLSGAGTRDRIRLAQSLLDEVAVR